MPVTVAHCRCKSDSFPSLDTLLAVECWRGRGETLTPILIKVFKAERWREYLTSTKSFCRAVTVTSE